MAAVTICRDFGAPQNKAWHCFHCSPIYFPWSDGTRCHDLHFLNVELKPTFSLSSLTFIKRLFSSSSLSAIRVVSFAYLRLLIFFPEVLIPAWDSSSPAFHMMYAAYTEKAMAPHSSTLAWKIPWMEEPRRLQSMVLQRVGHDWAISLSLFTFMHWRRKWQPTLMEESKEELKGLLLKVKEESEKLA